MPQPDPADDAAQSKSEKIATLIADVLLPAAGLVSTWIERSLAIQERIAVALEAKAADVDRDAIYKIVEDAYGSRYDGSGRAMSHIIREKYGARVNAALGIAPPRSS